MTPRLRLRKARSPPPLGRLCSSATRRGSILRDRLKVKSGVPAGVSSSWKRRQSMIQLLGSCETGRSEEHTSALQSLMRISYAVFCLKKKKKRKHTTNCNIDRNIKNTREMK